MNPDKRRELLELKSETEPNGDVAECTPQVPTDMSPSPTHLQYFNNVRSVAFQDGLSQRKKEQVASYEYLYRQ